MPHLAALEHVKDRFGRAQNEQERDYHPRGLVAFCLFLQPAADMNTAEERHTSRTAFPRVGMGWAVGRGTAAVIGPTPRPAAVV
ncbi:hypothetical protein BM1_02073 [Bipolaris maydis]|nr:hypothetical protein BM1_02073 [Bipolaris maydis]